MYFRTLSFALLLALFSGPSLVHADFIFEYTGQAFNFAEAPFTTSDRVTGTVVFENIGDDMAKSATLNVSGAPGLTIAIPDLTMPPSGFDIFQNFFSWSGSTLVEWDLLLSGNVAGGSAPEDVSISNLLGDQVLLDFPTGATAFSGGAGSLTAVPEPSSILTCGLAGVLAAFRRKRHG